MAAATDQTSMKHIAICGGGLVGALNACYMAKRGFSVELFEMRPDIRTQKTVRGRSINMTLSARGREALRRIGMEEQVLQKGIIMYARMIHDPNGTLRPIPYGRSKEGIISVDRRLLNELLLDAAQKYPNVTIHFNHKLVKCHFDTGEIVFIHNGHEVRRTVDLIVGNDGAFSGVRQQMMKLPELHFNYQQEYIPHGYMELNIPPTHDGQFAMEKHNLHIWPRNDFMMLAMPNLDRSFTTTLFMPFDMFNSINTEEKLMDFFHKTFPDSLPLLGEANLKKSYMKSKALPMVSIKCDPYHVGEKAVILGDAAHAMVPFYGQGMNCGFEDCLLLSEMLDKYDNDFARALPAYTECRNLDAKTMCDLAMYNYIELRASVNSPMFRLRKKVDHFLNALFPSFWIPLYSSVSFSRMRYQQCIANRAWQDKVLNHAGWSAAGMVSLGVLLGLYKQAGNGAAISHLFSRVCSKAASVAQGFAS